MSVIDKNIYFSTYHSPSHIIVRPDYTEPPSQIKQYTISAIFSVKKIKAGNQKHNRFILRSDNSLVFNKEIEVARLPCVKYNIDPKNQCIELIGLELDRDFKDFEEIKQWREKEPYIYVKRPINLRIQNDSPVRIQVLEYTVNDMRYAALSLAPLGT